MDTLRTACLIDQISRKTQLGDIMISNIEALVVDAGLFGSLWDIPVPQITKYIATHRWMYATIEYNYEHTIKISLPHGQLKPHRAHDKPIMQCALDLFEDVYELRSVNRVRMVHNVFSLTEISLANRRGLDHRYLQSKQCHIKKSPSVFQQNITLFLRIILHGGS